MPFECVSETGLPLPVQGAPCCDSREAEHHNGRHRWRVRHVVLMEVRKVLTFNSRLTSAQICDLAVQRGVSKVVLLCRGHLKGPSDSSP